MVMHLTGGDWGKKQRQGGGARKRRAVLMASLAGAENSDGALKVDKSDEVAGLQTAWNSGPKS